MNALIYDGSELLSTYVATLSEADAAVAQAYTNGYAMAFYHYRSWALSNDDHTIGGCAGGYLIGEGEDYATPAEGSPLGVSCWTVAYTFTPDEDEDAAALGVATVSSEITAYYDDSSYNTTTFGEGSLEVVTLGSDYPADALGFDKTWSCVADLNEETEIRPLTPMNTVCSRFLPLLLKGEYYTHTSSDFLFDSSIMGFLGDVNVDDEGVMTVTWVEPGSETYIWNSAFKAATAFGAAAMLVLAF